MPLLEVDEVSVRFGGIVALDDLSFTIDDGQICGLIGPNGAGKTTLFNVVSRIYEPTDGRDHASTAANLLEVPAHGIAGVGVARTFQNLALFPTMTVLENVMVGAHLRPRRSTGSPRRCASGPSGRTQLRQGARHGASWPSSASPATRCTPRPGCRTAR